MDPTPDKLYLKRKSIPMVDTITDEAHQPALPREGWSKDLKYLPTFNDININTYTHKSGKKAFNESERKKRTCIRPVTRGYQFYAENYVHDMWCSKNDNLYFVKACFASFAMFCESKEEWQTPRSVDVYFSWCCTWLLYVRGRVIRLL